MLSFDFFGPLHVVYVPETAQKKELRSYRLLFSGTLYLVILRLMRTHKFDYLYEACISIYKSSRHTIDLGEANTKQSARVFHAVLL